MFLLALAPGRLVCLNKSGSVFSGKAGGRKSAGFRFLPGRDRRSEKWALANIRAHAKRISLLTKIIPPWRD